MSYTEQGWMAMCFCYDKGKQFKDHQRLRSVLKEMKISNIPPKYDLHFRSSCDSALSGLLNGAWNWGGARDVGPLQSNRTHLSQEEKNFTRVQEVVQLTNCECGFDDQVEQAPLHFSPDRALTPDQQYKETVLECQVWIQEKMMRHESLWYCREKVARLVRLQKRAVWQADRQMLAFSSSVTSKFETNHC